MKRFTVWAGLLMAAVFGVVDVDAAETPLIPRKSLFGNPDKAAARISPDGKHLSYLSPVDGVLNVWVAPIDRPDEARPRSPGDAGCRGFFFWGDFPFQRAAGPL